MKQLVVYLTLVLSFTSWAGAAPVTLPSDPSFAGAYTTKLKAKLFRRCGNDTGSTTMQVLMMDDGTWTASTGDGLMTAGTWSLQGTRKVNFALSAGGLMALETYLASRIDGLAAAALAQGCIPAAAGTIGVTVDRLKFTGSLLQKKNSPLQLKPKLMVKFLASAAGLSIVDSKGLFKLSGISSNEEPLDVDASFLLEANRDPATGRIAPILSENPGNFDGAEVDSPSVIDDAGRPGGDRYVMYYEGESAGGISTIGMLSSGEEDFSTSIIARTQIIGLGGGGSGHDVGATDPVVIVDKSVAYGVDGRYHLWFEGRSGAGGSTSTIIHATSADGASWMNFAACTGLTPSFGDQRVADPTVLKEGALYRMWFEAVATGDISTIGYAESANGVAWQVKDANGNVGAAASAVFGLGATGNFDAAGVHAPSVVQGTTGTYLLFYEASDSTISTENSIGIATGSDGLTWTNPQLPLARPSSDSISPLPFDSGDIEHPAVLIDPSVPTTTVGHLLLYYTGDGENNASPNRIGLRRGRAGS